MADQAWLRLVRHEDLLVCDVELSNLRVSDDGQRLERTDAGAPAYLAVHLPPQHVAERAFFAFTGSGEPADQPPVGALSSGPSRLVFALPEDVADLALSVDAILDWARLTPRLTANALPPDATEGPAPAVPAAGETAVEFPYRLLLSPDAAGRWVHRRAAFTVDGRTELWHTRLDNGRPTVPLRAVGRRPEPDRLRTSLTDRDLDDLVTLTADFTVRPKGWRELGLPFHVWIRMLHLARLSDYHYVPRPLEAEQLMLTALGSSARLRGQWEYPPPDRDPLLLRRLGMPAPSLQQYEHVAGLGRDQFVRVVRRGFVSTGHRASIVKVTERRFEPRQLRTEQREEGTVGVFGATAYLRQTFTIVVQEPEKRYTELAGGYAHGGREMPLRSLRLTTLVTPPIDLPVPMSQVVQGARVDFLMQRYRWPVDEAELEPYVQRRLEATFMQPFWIKVAGADFEFGIQATDWEGQPVTLTSPLVFIPYEAAGKTSDVLATFEAGALDSRRRELHNQSVALADPSGSTTGSTRAPVSSLTFALQAVPADRAGALPDDYRPRWLPWVEEAEAHLEPVERLTGRREAVGIRFDPAYLAGGLAPAANPAGVFAALITPLPVAFGGEGGGGLARPDATVALLSSRQGALPQTFAKPAVSEADLAALFDGAKLFGSVKLGDILAELGQLGPEDFAVADLPEEALQQLLDDPTRRLGVPVLRTRVLERDGTPYAVEARFVWKPPLRSRLLFVFDERSELVLDARTVTPVDGGEATSEVRGELRNFALSFFGVAAARMQRLAFTALPGRKPDITAEGFDLSFQGPLRFINTLRDVLPADGFSDPPAVEVTTEGISAGYSLGVPSVGVGIFSIQNLALSAALAIPFSDRPAGIRFALSERHSPFLVTVTIFGGGGFFSLGLSAEGVEEIEAAIEFGGNLSLNLGVASGGVYVMAGIYFGKTAQTTTLTGYLRCGGYLSVLGLISISIEFYLAFTYREVGGGSEVWGQASVSVCVEIAFFSKTVSLSVERRFAGAAGDPTFADCVEPEDWESYCLAFAS